MSSTKSSQTSSTSGAPQVNADLLKKLIEMGIEERIARKALTLTNNESLELASSLALDLMDGDIEDDVPVFKVIFVVNTGLPLTSEDMALHVADGMLKIYHEVLLSGLNGKPIIDSWRMHGENKILMKVANKKHLEDISGVASDARIPWVMVKTHDGSVGSEGVPTVLALMGTEQETELITKKVVT